MDEHPAVPSTTIDPIRSDIRLILAESSMSRGVLCASAGTTFCPGCDLRGYSYLPNAAVPCGGWRELLPDELDRLLHPGERFPLHVGLVRVDPGVWESFEELREILAATPFLESARAIAAADRWRGPISRAVQSVLRWTVDDVDSFAGIGLCVHPPGLPTVTYDEPRRGLIGLHVDSWYGDLSPKNVPGRICINLGSSCRHFLFSPVSLSGMELAMKAEGMKLNPRGDLARGYFRSFPSHPILRLRVGPGEAYIAPTESISHDGSTQDHTGWDLTLTVRGRFLADSIKFQQGEPKS